MLEACRPAELWSAGPLLDHDDRTRRQPGEQRGQHGRDVVVVRRVEDGKVKAMAVRRCGRPIEEALHRAVDDDDAWQPEGVRIRAQRGDGARVGVDEDSEDRAT